jgi:hypothetical protein
MKRFQIKYTGKTMSQFPEDNYSNCPSSAPAYEVLDWNGVVRMVGTADMCDEFVQLKLQR